MFSKKKVAMLVAEFLGAALLSLAFYSIVARTTFPLFSGLAAGGTAALAILIFGKVSGGHINPAVTFGLWTARKISTLQAIAYIAAQMVGGLAAWWLLTYFMGHSLQSIAGSKFEWKILIAEGIGAAIFTFGVAAAVYQKYEGSKLASVVGVSFFLGIIVASLASNAVLNPAVALGIQSWSWAYAVGPLAGGLVGVNIYAFLFEGDKWPTMPGTKPARVTAKSTKKKPVARKRK